LYIQYDGINLFLKGSKVGFLSITLNNNVLDKSEWQKTHEIFSSSFVLNIVLCLHELLFCWRVAVYLLQVFLTDSAASFSLWLILVRCSSSIDSAASLSLCLELICCSVASLSSSDSAVSFSLWLLSSFAVA
jgi:hypothetical protein